MRLATGTAAGRAGRKAALIHAVLETLEQRQLLSVQGEYYNVDPSSYAFTSLVGRRTDANIDFAWGGQSPIAGAEGAAFAARWTGTLTPTQSGSYTFKTSTDDGVRLWIDNSKVVDYWWRGVYDKYSAPVQLTAGQTYNVRMEYFQLWSGSKCSLAWSRDGGAYAAVPASVLSLPTQTPFSGSAPSIDPAGTTIQAEDFDIGSNGVSYYDTTAGNAGGSSYRANIDADIETFATGARAVGYVAPGEWLEYAINVPQNGDYTLDARVASSGQGGSFHVAFNDVDKTGSWTIPSTGSWTTYATQSRTVNLSAGQQIMRVCFDANGPGGCVGNVDWLKLTPLAPAAPTNLVATAISSSRIDLSWQDNSSNESGFAIQRARDAQFTVGLAEFTAAANTTSYSDTTVQPGQSYFYRVSASGTGGSSAASASASVTAMLSLEEDPQVPKAGAFEVHGRFGKDGWSGDWEIGLTDDTNANPDDPENFAWLNEDAEPFVFNVTANHLATFTIGTASRQRTVEFDYDPSFVPEDLFIWAKTTKSSAGLRLEDMTLDGVGVDGMLEVGTSSGPTFSQTRILGGDMSDGWTLSGNVTLWFDVNSPPEHSQLQFHIQAGRETVAIEPDSSMVPVNSDDDDLDGTPDRQQMSTVIYEDDWIPVSLHVPSDYAGGTVTLSCDEGIDKVAVWAGTDKSGSPPILGYFGGTLTSQASWTIGSQPLTVWVEGLAPSVSLNDIGLVLAAEPATGQSSPPPATDRASLSTTQITLTGTKGAATQPVNLERAQQAGPNAPGWFINVNWDDDDADGWAGQGWKVDGTLEANAQNYTVDPTYTPDKDDSEITGGDNDLWPFTITRNVALAGSVKLVFPDRVKVWSTNTKTAGGQSSAVVSEQTLIPCNAMPKTLYLEGVSGSAAFKDVDLKAVYVPAAGERAAGDHIEVTVFGVNCTGFYGGPNGALQPQQQDNPIRLRDLNGHKYSEDQVGYASLTLNPDNGLWGFHNCMELRGSGMPAVAVGQQYPVEFDHQRWKWGRVWVKKLANDQWQFDKVNGQDADYAAWSPDGDGNMTAEPSNQNHLYAVDGPGLSDAMPLPTGANNYFVQTSNFRQVMGVNLYGTVYQCTSYFRWHSQVYLTPPPGPNDCYVRGPANLQSLGNGWMTIPAVPGF